MTLYFARRKFINLLDKRAANLCVASQTETGSLMCKLAAMFQGMVKEQVRKLVEKQEPFTGYEVYLACCLTIHEGNRTLPSDISSYVRELYNAGEFGPWWASTSIDKGGPLLYFVIQPVTCVQIGKPGRKGSGKKTEGKDAAVKYQIVLTEKILKIRESLSKSKE